MVDDHRLADGAAGGHQDRADDAGQGGGQDRPGGSVSDLRGAKPVADPSRSDCGTALMMSSDSDEMNGMFRMPITMPAVITEEPELPRPSRFGEPVAQERADGDQREEAEHHGRDAGDHLDQRLDHSCGPRREAYSAR